MAADTPIPRLTDPDGHVVYTFTLRLPFPLRLVDGYIHTFALSQDSLQAGISAAWPGKPFVRIRLHNVILGDFGTWTDRTAETMEYFYGLELPDAKEWPQWGVGQAYEQWVSLETPSYYLAGENLSDSAYAFHRSLTYLSLFVQAHGIAFRDPRVHPFSTYDLAPLVLRRQYLPDETWEFLGPMLVHPDAVPIFELLSPASDVLRQRIDEALQALALGYPYLSHLQWQLRAARAEHITGDYANAIVSLQTSIESRLYDTWRMILTDEGRTAAEIDRVVGADQPYKALVTSVLPRYLGGAGIPPLPTHLSALIGATSMASEIGSSTLATSPTLETHNKSEAREMH